MKIIDNSLVFEKCNLSTGDIEALLLCLGKVRPLVECKFGIVYERVMDIIIFCSRILLCSVVMRIVRSQSDVEHLLDVSSACHHQYLVRSH